MRFLSDCAGCMAANSREIRQSMGCGFEPPIEIVERWEPEGREPRPGELDEDGRELVPTCPGYVCKLPDVLEVARARVHWQKNAAAFTAVCGGEPTDQLLHAIEVLEGAHNDMEHRLFELKRSNGRSQTGEP